MPNRRSGGEGDFAKAYKVYANVETGVGADGSLGE